MKALFSARTFFFLALAFIVYGTTIPWDLAHAPALDRVEWIPFWDATRERPPSIPDLVQNVVLFVPLGFFGALWLRRRTALALAGVVGFAAILSVLVEVVQTMSETRTPSVSDVITNTLGALLGALAGRALGARFGEVLFARLDAAVRASPGLVVLAAYTVLVTAGALAPFIPTLDVSTLKETVRGFLGDPWGPKPLGALVPDAVLFAALAFLSGRDLLPFLVSRSSRGTAVVRRSPLAIFGFSTAVALAGALELAQLFFVGHSAGIQDVVAAAGGALVGAVVLARIGPARPGARPALGSLTREAPGLVLAFAVAAPLARALSPFAIVPLSEKLADFSLWQLVPFWAFIRNVNFATLRNVVEVGLYYVPLGYALTVLGRPPAFVFGAAVLLAEVLEVLQLPIEGRTFDVTEGLYAGLCALAGARVLSVLGVPHGRGGGGPLVAYHVDDSGSSEASSGARVK